MCVCVCVCLCVQGIGLRGVIKEVMVGRAAPALRFLICWKQKNECDDLRELMTK